MPFSALSNPLGGTFDLSRCGDTGTYLSISTGYRKQKEEANASKVEIWITPRFLIEKELSTRAAHFRDVMATWPAVEVPLGLFWTWGGWDSLEDYEYLTTLSVARICAQNLYLNYYESQTTANPWSVGCADGRSADRPRCYTVFM
jgi:hypothetical protein